MERLINKIKISCIIAAVAIAGCSGQSRESTPSVEFIDPSPTPAETIVEVDPTQNPTEIEPTLAPQEDSQTSGSTMEILYSSNFDVTYLEDGVKIVTDGANQRFLLLPDGVEKPDGYDDLRVVNIPVKHMLLGSSTHPSLLRPLGDDVFDAVSAVTTYDIGEGHIEQIDERMETGNIQYVGKTDSLDYEKIQAAGVDIAFLTRNVDTVGPKLDELGIPYVVENSSLEVDPLGRMEWTKLFAAFLDKESEATTHIDEAAARIDSVAEKVSGLEQPTVIAGFFYEGEYSVRTGGSYNARMHAMAGGDYLFRDYLTDQTGSTKITPEDFYTKGVDADFLMYEPMGDPVDSIADIVEQAPILADVKAIQEGNVWSYQSWWYRSVDKLDEIIEDYAAIYHPDAFPDHEVTYFFKVPAEAQ